MGRNSNNILGWPQNSFLGCYILSRGRYCCLALLNPTKLSGKHPSLTSHSWFPHPIFYCCRMNRSHSHPSGQIICHLQIYGSAFVRLHAFPFCCIRIPHPHAAYINLRFSVWRIGSQNWWLSEYLVVMSEELEGTNDTRENDMCCYNNYLMEE